MEADEICLEELEAAAEMWDDLKAGTFYEKQEKSGFSIKYLKEKIHG